VQDVPFEVQHEEQIRGEFEEALGPRLHLHAARPPPG
jgi:hypothetical protein